MKSKNKKIPTDKELMEAEFREAEEQFREDNEYHLTVGELREIENFYRVVIFDTKIQPAFGAT